MAQRRGFLAEVQHQQRLAQSRANAAARAQTATQAQAQRARAAQVRASAAADRASEAERKAFEREALAAYVESRQAEVAELNEDLAFEYQEIDGLLAATLDVDDFVDLEALKRKVAYPNFPRPDLEIPNPTPLVIQLPPQPSMREPEAPTGLFGRRKKQEEAQQLAEAEYRQLLHQWEEYRDSIPAKQSDLNSVHAGLERARHTSLVNERSRYEAACRRLEDEVTAHNASIDALIAGLGYGVAESVQEYIGIVLANSVYPHSFDVVHEADFDPESSELALRVIVPAPETIRTVKGFRYSKANDEVLETQLTKKDVNDRYAGALNQVALRSMHEIFEADRRGLIKAISLQVGPLTREPATGREMFLPLVAVTSSRDTFMELQLSAVVPAATLLHLGAAVSKNPTALATINVGGVRRS